MSLENSALCIVASANLATSGAWSETVFEAWNKKIVRSAFGGYESCDFHLRGKRSVEEWLDTGLGRHIEVFSPGLSQVFEGFANVVQANIGGLTITRGPFINIGNKVCTEYSTIDWSSGDPVYGARRFTDWAEDTTSQKKYGVLHRVVSTAGCNETRAEQIRDIAIGEVKEPETSETTNIDSSSISSVTIQCLGYIHWLKTYTVDLTTEGEQNASDKLEAVLDDEPNGIFSTDYSRIDSNTSQVGAEDRDRRQAYTVAKALTALGGTALNRWVLKFIKNRQVVFSAMPTTAKYERNLFSPSQNVGLYGSGTRVMPWQVEAGQWLFHGGELAPRSSSSDFRTDPRYVFIEQATYREPWQLALVGSRSGKLKQLLNQFGVGGYHP